MESSNPTLNGNVFAKTRAAVGSGETMTVQGTINKTFALFAVILLTAGWSWNASLNPSQAPFLGIAFIVCLVVGLILGIATPFNPSWAPVSGPIYAACQGILMGMISSMFEHRYPGIVVQAVGLTMACLFTMLVAYRSGWIQATEGFRKGIIIATMAICLFYFFSNSFILDEFSRMWEVPATHYKDLKTYDAGIVLGGKLSYDSDFDRIQFQRGADRLLQAVELYKTGTIKKIFFTGGSGSIEFAQMKEGMFVRRYLLTLGIPDRDIWIENESKNTRENALYSLEFLERHEFQGGKFLLITSGHHMRRALGCFRTVDIEVTPYSVERNAGTERRFGFDHLFIPNVNTLIWWEALIHEWIGMIVYKIKGFA